MMEPSSGATVILTFPGCCGGWSAIVPPDYCSWQRDDVVAGAGGWCLAVLVQLLDYHEGAVAAVECQLVGRAAARLADHRMPASSMMPHTSLARLSNVQSDDPQGLVRRDLALPVVR